MQIRCPHCHNPIEVVDTDPLTDVSCPECGSNFSLLNAETASYTPGAVRTIGHFELLESVGVGRFGTVWKARDTKLDRMVAVKIPRRGQIEGPEAEMFIREARAAAQVKHPGVVGVHEVGREDETLYIVSDFIDGLSLKEWLSRRQLTPQEAAELCAKIAEALDVAHEAGVVHRDLKPGNVMMDAAGQPHLTDFGLAKREAGEITMTLDGQLLGTPAYMSPEQARGEAHKADRRSDVYSLGVILFELLTGELPFRGNQRMMVFQILQDEPPSPRKLQIRIPRDLETICLKCLEKSPGKRYQTAAELAAELRRFLRGEPIVARPVGRPERLWRWCRRQPVVAGLSAAAVVLMVLVAVVSSAGYLSTSRALHQVVAAQRERALAQVDTLRTAEISRVPDLIEALKPFRDEIVPYLRQSLQPAEMGEEERLRLSLVMVTEDEGQVAYLRDRLLSAGPAEFLVIRAALLPHRGELAAGMWRTVEDPAAGRNHRFRALCALAAFDPESPRWKNASKPAADALVAENPLVAVTWVEALRPVRRSLLPALQTIFRDQQRGDPERSLATDILADYAADQPQVLADLVMDADEKQFAVIYTRLKERGEEGLPLLQGEIKKPLPDATEEAKEALAKRQANAAVALLRMNHADKLWPLLTHSPDPRVRSWVIHKLGPLGADPGLIVKRLGEESEVSIRRALLLSLGEFGQQTLTVSERDSLVEKLRVLYRNEPDPGLHAAVEWLLHQWKQDKWLKHLEQEWANDKQQTEQRLQSIGKGLATGKAEPQWYVTSQGQTMVIIPGPVEFLMGSPPSESQRSNDEQLHLKRIGRTFAIAAKAVTVEQFLRFRKGYDRLIPRFAPTADCPVHGTTWYDAAEYCNWLSKQEGLPEKQWCYEPNQDGKYEEGMKMPPDYVKRSGYRLPTNSEWEYACRAGAVTSRYYGQSEELLAKYGWCLRSSRSRSWPVGSLKPNDLGLFDMHGNVWAWCQDRNTSYALGQGGKAMDDKGDVSPPLDKEPRVLRGGGFAAEPEDLRSAKRNIYQPGYRSYGASFRPARTFDDKRQGTERAEEPRRPVLDYVAELKSFGAEKLTEGACPRWSPDGKKIVFSQVPDGAGTGLYDLETRKGTTLVRPGKDAAWSPAPNGPIASVRGEGEKEEIWLMEASGANPRKVADGGFPSWGSAGKTLFFHSRTLGRVMALRLPEPKLTAPDSGPRLDAWYPVISPDESKIAAAGGQWLRVLELKSGKILKEWPTDWGGGVVGWSPDSKWVGFGGFGHEDDGLWLLHLDEDKAYRVLPGPCTCPAWSPDGQQIAFDMRTAEGNSIWYIKSALIYQRHAAEAKKDRPAEDDHGVTTRSGPPLNP